MWQGKFHTNRESIGLDRTRMPATAPSRALRRRSFEIDRARVTRNTILQLYTVAIDSLYLYASPVTTTRGEMAARGESARIVELSDTID